MFERFHTSFGSRVDRTDIEAETEKAVAEIEASYELVDDVESEMYLDSLKMQAIRLIAELLLKLGFDTDTVTDLTEVDVVFVKKTQSGGMAEYTHPGDRIFVDHELFNDLGDIEILNLITHELWHALSGVKQHFHILPDGTKRNLGTIGFTKHTFTYHGQGWENNDSEISIDFAGLDEAMTDLLTITTLKNQAEPSITSYPTQLDALEKVIAGVAHKEKIDEREVFTLFTKSYLNKDLFFLKLIHKHYGEPGIEALKKLSAKHDENAAKINAEIGTLFKE